MINGGPAAPRSAPPPHGEGRSRRPEPPVVGDDQRGRAAAARSGDRTNPTTNKRRQGGTSERGSLLRPANLFASGLDGLLVVRAERLGQLALKLPFEPPQHLFF